MTSFQAEMCIRAESACLVREIEEYLATEVDDRVN